MSNATVRKRHEEDDAQLNVWQFIAPAQTGDLCTDLVELMKVMARQRDLFGVTVGELVERFESTTGRRVGGEPRATKQEEQRQTSWLARVPKIAGLKATGNSGEVR